MVHNQQKKSRVAPQIAILVPIFIVLFVIVFSATTLIEREYRNQTEATLKSVLNGIVTAFYVWESDLEDMAQEVARDQDLIAATKALLSTDRTEQHLVNTQALKSLRVKFSNKLAAGTLKGFFIIDSNNINIAATHDRSLGIANILTEQPDILANLWKGDASLSRPQRSDVPIGESGMRYEETMFAGAPIRDNDGRIIALLTLRLDPHERFIPLFTQARVGDTGESYAFDKSGLMLTTSRFEQDIVEAGLVSKGKRGTLEIYIRDPGNDISDGTKPRVLVAQQSLTLMASSAVKANNSANVDGYRDYRGIPVIGAWYWHDKLGVGMTTEQDVAEAYVLLNYIKQVIYGIALVTAFVILLLMYVFNSSRRRVGEIKNRLQAIVDTASNGVVVIDQKGVVESANPATTELFSYLNKELIGANLRALFPNLKTTQTELIRLELDARRKDGTLFPAELSVSEIRLESGIRFAVIIRDITVQKKAEQLLKDERNFTRLVVDSLDAHIAVLNEHGEIMFVNDVWNSQTVENGAEHHAALLGATDSNSRSQQNPHNSLKLKEVTQQLRELLSGQNQEFVVEYPWQAPRQLYWYRLRAKRTLHNGAPVVVISYSDITERKQAETELFLAIKNAEAANSAKSTFLATMSHEIRTPLNGVVATIELLSQSEMDEQQEELLHTAQESSTLLLGIIDDILDFSKIEAGKLELDPKQISLEELVEGLVESQMPNAIQKGVDLYVYCDPHLPEVMADPVRIRQIIYNLLTNAVKFSSGQATRGSVLVSVNLTGQPDGSAQIQIKAQDNGIGINQDVQKKLFSPFTQGEGNITRRYGGTGLGLVICRRLVEIMDGTISLKSKEGEGSTFVIALTLPLGERPSSSQTYDLSGVDVLMVMDDEKLSQGLHSYLNDVGASVTLCLDSSSLDSSHAFVASTNDKVLVIDNDGDSASARKKVDAVMQQLGVESDLDHVVLSRGRRRFARAISDAGLVIDLNGMRRLAFLQAVAIACGRASPDKPKAEAVKGLQVSEGEREHRSHYKVLLIDDNSTNRKVIAQQLSLLGYVVDVAADGGEGLEKWEQGGYSLLLTDCHMPVMDGYQLSRAIRSRETQTRIPIIAITADALKGTETLCKDAGMDDYLSKPVKLLALQDCLNQWLDQAIPSSQALFEINPELIAEPEAQRVEGDRSVNVHTLAELIGTNDQTELAEYYLDFIKSSEPTIAALQEAIKSSAFSEIRQLAHKFKSSARTVGADSLADCCTALEEAGKQQDISAVKEKRDLIKTRYSEVSAWIGQYTKRSAGSKE